MRRTLFFIDLENVSLSLRQHRRREFDAGETLKAAGGRRFLRWARAYGDFRIVPEGLARHLDAHHVQCIHVPARGGSQQRKDLVDLVLSLDLADSARLRGIDEVVLASGDCDFIPAVSRLLEAGKRVRLLAVKEALSGELAALVGEENVTDLTGGKPLVRPFSDRVPTARLVSLADSMPRALGSGEATHPPVAGGAR